jgi:hypothetical protein
MARSGLGWYDQIAVLLSTSPVFVVVLGVGVPAAVLPRPQVRGH